LKGLSRDGKIFVLETEEEDLEKKTPDEPDAPDALKGLLEKRRDEGADDDEILREVFESNPNADTKKSVEATGLTGLTIGRIKGQVSIRRKRDSRASGKHLEERKMTSGTNWGSTQIGRVDEVFPTELKVFTTNYDTCLEVYFNRREIDYCRGIVNRSGEDVLDVDSYASHQTTNVKIYKLHGSIDLFQKRGKIRQFKAPGTGKTFLGDEYGEESMRWLRVRRI